MQFERIIDQLRSRHHQIEYIKDIKSGKEASVYLLLVDNYYRALKVYKAGLKYSTKQDYISLAEIGDSRTIRAIKNKSATGIDSMTSTWTAREFKTMSQISFYTQNVPEVYDFGKDYILMEFIGTEENPAPRLSDLNLTKPKAEACLIDILDCIKLFIENDFVHGDLSAYNILFHQDFPVIIDFPQILNISKNPHAYNKLVKDIDNIKSYFASYNFPFLDKELKVIYDEFFMKSRYG